MVSYSKQLMLKASIVGSIIKNAVDLSRGKEPLSVHSVFKRVVNVNTSLGLISIVNKGIGKSASYIIIDQDVNFEREDIKPMDIVGIRENTLIFNSFIVDMERAVVWKDIIKPWHKYQKSIISTDNIRIFKASMDRYASKNSFWGRFQYDRYIGERIEKLKGEKPSEGVKGMIGLGPGLTPSGDDVLLGFISIVNTCDDFISERENLKNEILYNLKYTSDISAYFLKMALKNHYHEYVQNVICSLVNGTPEEAALSVRRLLTIGATSGADIALGMYLAFSM